MSNIIIKKLEDRIFDSSSEALYRLNELGRNNIDSEAYKDLSDQVRSTCPCNCYFSTRKSYKVEVNYEGTYYVRNDKTHTNRPGFGTYSEFACSGSGTGTSETDYQPYTRISNSSPNLTCQTEDIYTTSGSSTGNKALTQPIGLISADEAMFAGMPNWNSSGNTNNYLYTRQDYWTISTSWYGYNAAHVFYVRSNGDIDYINSVTYVIGVRPVINLRADVELTGTGSQNDPFKIVGAS